MQTAAPGFIAKRLKGFSSVISSSSGHYDVEREIEVLHKDVRLGRFEECRARANLCLKYRSDEGLDDVVRLRIHSLAWEVFDSFGEYAEAATILDLDGLSDNCRKQLRDAIQYPEKAGFVSGRKLVRNIYDLWRQRVMVVMIRGFAEYRLQNLSEVEHWLNTADNFVHNRLVSEEFPCNGTLMRLRYFQGQLAHRRRLFQESRRCYDESLHYCRLRLQERLSEDQAGIEQEYSRYCLAKLHLKFGELGYDWGRLNNARRHLETSITLLSATKDNFLRARASLLWGIATRAEMKASEKDLFNVFLEARRALAKHPVYGIEARMEEIVTAVYLLRERVQLPSQLPKELQKIESCGKQMEVVIRDADDLKLISTAFRARIARARILVRQQVSADPDGFPNEALDAIREAEEKYVTAEPIPLTLQYEARYVEGLAQEAKRNWPSAAKAYEKALEFGRDNMVVSFACLRRIANAYLKDDHIAAAQRAADECVDLAPQIRNPRLQADLDQLLRNLRKRQKELRIRYSPSLTRSEGHLKFDRFFLEQLGASINVSELSTLQRAEKLRQLNNHREIKIDDREIKDLIKIWDGRSQKRG